MDDGKLVGILTNHDVRFIEDASAIRVGEVMTSKNLVTVHRTTSLEGAKRHLPANTASKSSWWWTRTSACAASSP